MQIIQQYIALEVLLGIYCTQNKYKIYTILSGKLYNFQLGFFYRVL